MIKKMIVLHTPEGDVKKIQLLANAGKLLTLDGISFWNYIYVDDENGWYEADIQDDNI